MDDQDNQENPDYLDELQSTVTSLQYKRSEGGMGAWWAVLVVAVLAVLGTAIAAWRARKAGKKLAKLLHEKAISEEQQRQAEADARREVYEVDRRHFEEKADGFLQEVKKLEETIAEQRERHERALDTIDALETWADVDRYLGR